MEEERGRVTIGKVANLEELKKEKSLNDIFCFMS